MSSASLSRLIAIAATALILFGAAIVLGVKARAQQPQPLAVDVTNASEPVLCAEWDNVTLNFASSAVRQFRVEAGHPAYLGMLQRDSYEPDWTNCKTAEDPNPGSPGPAPLPPKRVTLYEQIDFWVVGLTLPNFWRPATATVRIGDRVAKDIHLLQIWMISHMGGEEVLVLYPQDGYWRLRVRTPPGVPTATAYGSSVLIGPIDIETRPIVKIKEVALDPKTRTFTLTFERGGTATVRMSTTDTARNALDVSFDRAIEGRPFAAMRSMYITDFNNDVARIAVREKGTPGWREEGIMAFKRSSATDVWAGRIAPSRHNTSSPDMVFSSFSDGRLPMPAPAGK